MNSRLEFEIWGGELANDLLKNFVGDETWPVPAASLAALTDLGVPDDKIAEYFGVDVTKVASLRESYGL